MILGGFCKCIFRCCMYLFEVVESGIFKLVAFKPFFFLPLNCSPQYAIFPPENRISFVKFLFCKKRNAQPSSLVKVHFEYTAKWVSFADEQFVFAQNHHLWQNYTVFVALHNLKSNISEPKTQNGQCWEQHASNNWTFSKFDGIANWFTNVYSKWIKLLGHRPHEMDVALWCHKLISGKGLDGMGVSSCL